MVEKYRSRLNEAEWDYITGRLDFRVAGGTHYFIPFDLIDHFYDLLNKDSRLGYTDVEMKALDEITMAVIAVQDELQDRYDLYYIKNQLNKMNQRYHEIAS